MTELIIDSEVAERLRRLAQEENRSIDDVLRSALDSYSVPTGPSDWPLVMARIAEADTDIVWNDYAPDLAERSREILENEFGKCPTRTLCLYSLTSVGD